MSADDGKKARGRPERRAVWVLSKSRPQGGIERVRDVPGSGLGSAATQNEANREARTSNTRTRGREEVGLGILAKSAPGFALSFLCAASGAPAVRISSTGEGHSRTVLSKSSGRMALATRCNHVSGAQPNDRPPPGASFAPLTSSLHRRATMADS